MVPNYVKEIERFLDRENIDIRFLEAREFRKKTSIVATMKVVVYDCNGSVIENNIIGEYYCPQDISEYKTYDALEEYIMSNYSLCVIYDLYHLNVINTDDKEYLVSLVEKGRAEDELKRTGV